MADTFVEYLIENFAERVGRVRGNSLNEKVAFLRGRYLKTALDGRKESEAGNDTSIYRSAYASAHEDIGNMLVDFDESIEYLETEIISYIVTLMETTAVNKTPSSAGYLDAYGYMVAELRRAVEESNV
jgi:hypothetical protein